VILGNLLIQQELYPLIFPNRSENGYRVSYWNSETEPIGGSGLECAGPSASRRGHHSQLMHDLWTRAPWPTGFFSLGQTASQEHEQSSIPLNSRRMLW
jgi:hypothetical protein